MTNAEVSVAVNRSLRRSLEASGTCDKEVEVATVEDSHGKSEQIEISRENTPENAENLAGSIIADNDTTTPAVESEEEREVEE